MLETRLLPRTKVGSNTLKISLTIYLSVPNSVAKVDQLTVHIVQRTEMVCGSPKKVFKMHDCELRSAIRGFHYTRKSGGVLYNVTRIK